MVVKDWQNNVVATEETPETIITVWRIEDAGGEIFDYSYVIVRSFESLLAIVEGHLGYFGEPHLRDGIELKISLVDMTLGDYEALQK